jgi:Ca-activated chloride channel family protein
MSSPHPAGAADLKGSLGQAQSAYDSGDYDTAAQHFVSAQLEAPEKTEISYDLGNARYKAEDYDGALQAYRQVLETGDVTLQEKAHYNMGNAHFRNGDLDKAIESYEAALALDEADTQAKENLEFVKKLKENPPQQSSQGDQDQQEDQQKPGDNQQSGEQGQNGSDQQESKGDQQGEEDKNDQQPSSSPEEDQQPSSGSQEKQEESAGQKETSSPDEASLRQAEKMLNRLQDQPGKAMIPAYRQREVEKDW